jgi:hypothetical protein
MPKTSGLTSSQDSPTPFVRPPIRIRSSNSGEKAANRAFFAKGVSSYQIFIFPVIFPVLRETPDRGRRDKPGRDSTENASISALASISTEGESPNE